MNMMKSKQQRDRKHENIHGQHDTNIIFQPENTNMHNKQSRWQYAHSQKSQIKAISMFKLVWFRLEASYWGGFLVCGNLLLKGYSAIVAAKLCNPVTERLTDHLTNALQCNLRR